MEYKETIRKLDDVKDKASLDPHWFQKCGGGDRGKTEPLLDVVFVIS